MSDADPPEQPTLKFVLNSNLGLAVDKKPWSVILPAAGIVAEPTMNLESVARIPANHQADIAHILAEDFHRIGRKGDRHYRGLTIATSKFTGQPTQRSLPVVRRDDPATGLRDLQKVKYGYIKKSCSSSYFPSAVLLKKQGIMLADFLDLTPVRPFQCQIDAVVDGPVRATMVLEDVWKSTPKSAEQTKIIGQFDHRKPPIIAVRTSPDKSTRELLLDALVGWALEWGTSTAPSSPTTPTCSRSSTKLTSLRNSSESNHLDPTLLDLRG